MKKIMIDNRNGKIIAFALVAVLLLIGTVGLASVAAMGVAKGSTGLVVYYPFNGDAKDKSGNGNDGTVYGATWVDNGGCGKALSFDGTDDYVEVPASASLDLTDEITIAAWVKSNYIWGYQNIVDKGGGGPSAYQISFYQSKPYGWIKTADGVRHSYTGNPILQDNTWYHFVLTYDGYHYRYYINGQLSFETSLSGEIYTNDYELNIGREGGMANSAFFDGLIDEVCIYNYAKTQSQIQEDMRICTPSTPTATGEPTPAPYIRPCNSMDRKIIKAVGGCEAIDKSKYPAIYEVCCSKITKENLLRLLNEYLAAGRTIVYHEPDPLLEMFNEYLEMSP